MFPGVTLMAVAGFASAWMLLWGAAAAIPILLHYLYRRRQVTIRWAAMALLHQVIEREAKRIQIEQWLLLLLRTLVLLVLTLALARPFWQSDATAQGSASSEPATSWILAIDVSYSMGYRIDNETRLQAAQRRAIEIVQAAGPGDAFALLALGRPPRAAISSPSYDHSAVTAEIERLTLNDAGCDLKSGLQSIEDMAQRAQGDPAVPTRVRVLVLSDLGSDQWQAAVDGTIAKNLRQLGGKFPLEIESLGDEVVTNAAVTAVHASALRTLRGRPVEIDASIRNFGGSALEQLLVQMSVDGSTLASQRIDVAAQSEQTLRFTYTPSTVGLSVIAVSIPSDRLGTDNTRRQVIEVCEDFGVLYVEQQAGDARLLKLAVRPSEGGLPTAREVGRRRDTVSSTQLSTVDLSLWQAVVLFDLSQLDRPELARLERFVRDGGALICLWGPRSSASGWQASANADQLFGFRLREPSPVGNWGIDPLDYRSPLIAPFAGFPESGLLTTPIFRYWKIDPVVIAKADRVQQQIVDVATDGGEPLLLRQRLGEGMVASLLSAPQAGLAATDNWNAMAAWPSFVPLMQRLVQLTMDHGVAKHTVLAGQPLIVRSSSATTLGTGSKLVTVTQPDGSELQLTIEAAESARNLPWTFSQTQHSGVVWVNASDVDPTQPFVVNVDNSESDLRSVAVGVMPRSTAVLPATAGSPRSVEQAAEASPGMTRGLLIALGMLLISESWLAWVLGRRGQ